MPILVQWDNAEHTTVHWDFDGEWTWEMFQEAQKTSNRLIRSVRHQVDIIGDVHRSPSLPHNPLFRYNDFQHALPDNAGLIVLVGASIFVKTMASIFNRVYRFKGKGMIFADTHEEARTLLRKQHRKS